MKPTQLLISKEAKREVIQEEFYAAMDSAVFLQTLLETVLGEFPELEFPEFAETSEGYSLFQGVLVILRHDPKCPSLKLMTKTFFAIASAADNPVTRVRWLVDWVMAHHTKTLTPQQIPEFYRFLGAGHD